MFHFICEMNERSRFRKLTQYLGQPDGSASAQVRKDGHPVGVRSAGPTRAAQ